MIKHYTQEEIEKGSVLTDFEVKYIDDMAQAIFDQAFAEEHRPYVLMALCGAIASNVVRQSEGETDADTVMKFIDLSTRSQLE